MRSQLILIGITLALSRAANIDHRNCCTDFLRSPLMPDIAKNTHDTTEDEHFKSRHNKRDMKNVVSTKKPSQQKRNDSTADHFRSDGHVFSANRTFSVEDLVTYPTPREEYNRFGGHLEHIRIHCNSHVLAKMKNLIGDVDQPLETKVITLAISSVAIGCPGTAFYLTNLLMKNRNNQNFSHLIINEGPRENVSTPCNRSNVEKLKRLIKGNGKFVSIYELVAPTIFLSLKCDVIGQREFEQFLSDFKPNTNQTHISKNQRLVKYLNQRKGQLSTLVNFEKEEIREQNKNDSNSTENKREKRTSENNEIETNFSVHKKCAIIRPLGEALNPVSKIDCLQFCLDEEGCKSVGYKNDNSQVCQLNIENRKDVRGFFTCRTTDTGNWDYFEKKKSIDYFYISNKATAMVLEVKPDFSVIMKSYSGKDNQLWYWDNDAIRSKQYPSRLLQFSVSEYKSTGLGKTYLSSNQQGQNNLWNFEDNQFTSQYQNLKLDVKDGNKAEGTPAGVTVNSYQEWSLSLERIYFIITSRYSGKVLEADTQGNVHLGTYDGTDNQFWFWDDENIRCKKIPDKVLDLHMADYEATNWGKVYLHTYNTGNNQRWVADNDKIVSFYKNLSLDVNLEPNSNGIMVGGYASHGGINQKWSFAFSRQYFFILNKESGKVLDASSPTTIELRHYNFIDQQLWFWDNDVLRNKKYTDKVMDLHMYNYINHHWGKIYLHTFNDGDNQKWTIDNNVLLSKFNNLSVEVKSASQAEGSEIGASGRKSQKMDITARA